MPSPELSFKMSEALITKLNYSVLESATMITEKKLDPNALVFKYNIDIGVSFEELTEQITVALHISALDDKGMHTYFEAETLSVYGILNFEQLLTKEKKHYQIPRNMLLSLISIAISTSRGLLIGAINQPPLNYAILPIINPVPFADKIVDGSNGEIVYTDTERK